MGQIRSIILAILATMSSFAAPASAEWAKVIRVVDGDTIVVRLEGSEKVERVRYLGIDTPETVHPRKPVEPGGPEGRRRTRKRPDRSRKALMVARWGREILKGEG